MAAPEDRTQTTIDNRPPADVESTVDDERGSPDEAMVETNDTTPAREDPTATADDREVATPPPTTDDGEVATATVDDGEVANAEDREDSAATEDDATATGGVATDDTAANDGAAPAGEPTGVDMGGSAGTAEHADQVDAEMPPGTDDVEAPAQDNEGTAPEQGAPVPGMRAAAPGEIDASSVDLWPNEKITALRERWQAVQLHFVDDPTAAALEADALVAEAVRTLTDSLVDQRQDLAGWQGGDGGDTERLRVAVQRYRGFLDRLLGL